MQIKKKKKEKKSPTENLRRKHNIFIIKGFRTIVFIFIVSPNECPDMTLNNLMVRLLYCRSFGECGVPFHCSQVHSGLEW